MKKVFKFFAVLACVAISISTFAQSSQSANLENLKQGESVKISATKNGSEVSHLSVKKVEEGFGLSFNFSDPNVKSARIDFFRKGNKIFEYIDFPSNGPAPGDIDFTTEKELVHSSVVSLEAEDEDWWPLVVLAALCCLEGEVGSDGWSVGFDCDCLSVNIGMVVAGGGTGGQEIEADEIRITPLDSRGNPILDILTSSTVLVNR